jgi:hypothetical protein
MLVTGLKKKVRKHIGTWWGGHTTGGCGADFLSGGGAMEVGCCIAFEIGSSADLLIEREALEAGCCMAVACWAANTVSCLFLYFVSLALQRKGQADIPQWPFSVAVDPGAWAMV